MAKNNAADVFRKAAETTKRGRERQARMTEDAPPAPAAAEPALKATSTDTASKDTNLVMVAVRMTPEERTKLKVLSAQRGQSIQEMVREWLQSL